MKRMIATAVVFVLGCLAPLLSLADTYNDGTYTWTYTVADGKAEIGRGISPKPTGALEIPATLGGRPVTSIGERAFEFCEGLTSVTIPEGVTSIGDWAFACCYGLTSVTIPSSVTSIGERAFGSCVGLTAVTIPSGVTSIGDSAFWYCVELTSVTIPSSVTSIGDWVFSSCWGLTEIAVAEGNAAYCSVDGMLINKDKSELICCPAGKMGEVTIPEVVTSIGDGAFSGCWGLTSVTIPSSVTSIGERAFEFCSGLTSVTIPSSVTSIGDGAFEFCEGLMSVTIPAGVTSIGVGAFLGCSGLTSVTIPACVTRLSHTFPDAYQKIQQVVLSADVTSIGSSMFSGCSGLTSVTIPEGCKTISANAFQSCSALSEISLPHTLTTCDSTAFSSCKGIKSIAMPSKFSARLLFADSIDSIERIVLYDGATAIASGEFADFANLTEIRLPSTVRSIGDSAFANCIALTEVRIPASVTMISSTAFTGCASLQRVIFEGDAPDVLGEGLFFGTPRRLEVQVPDGSIGWDGSFSAGLPDAWEGRKIMHSGEEYDWGGGTGIVRTAGVSITVTNIAVCYVLNSVRPEFAVPPSGDTGFVSIVAEVKGGAFAVPESWAAEYPGFTEKFGTDVTKALAKTTGKKDGAGNPMFVWQDYVAGTDPTDETDVFTASITIVDGKVKVSYSPELDDARKVLRKYTTYGKAKLTDTEWTVVKESEEDNFNFFKVTVEMK